MPDYIKDTKLRYNYVYTNNDLTSFVLFSISSNLINLTELMTISKDILPETGNILINFYDPYKIKTIYEYSFIDNVFTIISSKIINTHIQTDGIVSKDSLNIIFDTSSSFKISIDQIGISENLIGRITIKNK